MVFDFFIGDLKCPKCGAVTSDSSTGIQMYVTQERWNEPYGPGARLKLDPIPFADYAVVREPAAGEAVRLLHGWACPKCGENFNWAVIVLKGDLVDKVESVTLDRAEFDRAHYIAEEDGRILAERLNGPDSPPLHGPAIVRVLRERLS